MTTLASTITPTAMDSLTSGAGRGTLAPAQLGHSCVARVDQPLLAADDGSSVIAPQYRVTRD